MKPEDLAEATELLQQRQIALGIVDDITSGKSEMHVTVQTFPDPGADKQITLKLRLQEDSHERDAIAKLVFDGAVMVTARLLELGVDVPAGVEA